MPSSSPIHRRTGVFVVLLSLSLPLFFCVVNPLCLILRARPDYGLERQVEAQGGRVQRESLFPRLSTFLDAPVFTLGPVWTMTFGKQADDDSLKCLEDTPEVTILSAGFTKITDEGLAHLRGLHKLAYLSLQHTKIGDGGLRDIEGMSAIKSLILNDTRITDSGFPSLVLDYRAFELGSPMQFPDPLPAPVG